MQESHHGRERLLDSSYILPINWDIPGKRLASLENDTQIFIAKLDIWALHMYGIKRAETDKCPVCIHIGCF